MLDNTRETVKINAFSLAIEEQAPHETKKYVAQRIQKATEEVLLKIEKRKELEAYLNGDVSVSEKINVIPTVNTLSSDNHINSEIIIRNNTLSTKNTNVSNFEQSVTISGNNRGLKTTNESNTLNGRSINVLDNQQSIVNSGNNSLLKTTDAINTNIYNINLNNSEGLGFEKKKLLEIGNDRGRDPIIEAIKQKIKTINYLLEKRPENDSLLEDKNYWVDVLRGLNNGLKYSEIYDQPTHERFKDFYYDFLTFHPIVDDLKSIYWEGVSEKMIKVIQNNLLKKSKADSYWEFLIKKLRNINVDVLQLFLDHEELFFILQEALNLYDLPQSINIYTKTKVYPKLFTSNIYASIGRKEIYGKLKGLELVYDNDGASLLQKIEEVELYTKGERIKKKDGKYPVLFEGQWYDKDRINNPTNPNSTFWKASVYNVEYNKAYLYRTIAQRHAFYKFADAYLKSKGVISEWFDAAAKVTINDLFTAEVTVGAASKGSFTSYFLSGDTKDFLRGGNKFLLPYNMKNVKALIEGKGTINLNFTDANGKQQTFEGFTKKQLDFKLVELEQTLVQEYINKYVKDNKTDSRFVKFLEKYNIKDTPQENLQDILDEINGLFKGKIVKEGKDITPYITSKIDKIVNEVVPFVDDFHIEDFSFIAEDITELIIEKHFVDDKGKIYFDFKNYEHRVKLGKLMVEKLYYQRYRDTIANKLELVRQKPKDFIVDVPKKFKDYVKFQIPEKRLFLKDYYEELKSDLERIDRIIINHKDHDIFDAEFIEEKLKLAYQTFIKTWQKNNPEFMDDIEVFYENLIKDYEAFKIKAKEALQNVKELPEAMQQDVINAIDEIFKYQEYNISLLKETKEKFRKIEETFNEGKKLFKSKIQEVKKIKNKYLTKEKIVKTALDTGALMLEDLAKEIYPDIVNIRGNDEGIKQELFKTSAEATVAILIYEFLKGEGKSLRKFDYNTHPFAKEMFQGRILEEIIKEVVDLMERDNHDFRNLNDSKNYQVKLEFSPNISLGKKVMMDYKNTSIQEKIKLIRGLIESVDKHLNSNWTQLFVGGSLAYVYIKNKEVHIKIENTTGRKSFALHLVENIKSNKKSKRPKMSDIKQEIYFSFKLP